MPRVVAFIGDAYTLPPFLKKFSFPFQQKYLGRISLRHIPDHDYQIMRCTNENKFQITNVSLIYHSYFFVNSWVICFCTIINPFNVPIKKRL
jgi:hypothetical protein